MADFGFGGSAPTLTQLQKLLSDNMPTPEASSAAPGTGGMAARGDHTHPRLSSANVQVLNSSSEATVAFTKVFSSMPVVIPTLYEADDLQPVVFKVKTWVRDAQGNYIGCTIKGSRSTVLPALSSIALIGPLIAALANFNVFGGSAAGAQFCYFAISPSA